MANIFLLQLFLAFIVGALWVTAATIIAEKFGSKIGGIIAGIPSTTVISLFFIGWTQTAATAANAATIVPAILGIDALFVAIYILLSSYGLVISLIISLLIWSIFSLILVLIKFNHLMISIILFIALLIISYLLVEKIIKVKSLGRRNIDLSNAQILFRIMLSGGIIVSSVILTKIGGYILGGVFAAFPAVMLSNIIITYMNHGRNFSVAVMKSHMTSGSINVTVYGVGVHFLYPLFGIITGTFLAFIISLMTAYITSFFVHKKMA